MVERCTNRGAQNYAAYGGRGISVCSRWLVFENFLADMGVRPANTSIERKHNDDSYCLANCVWASPKVQANNTRWNRLLTHDGRTLTVAQWAHTLGIPVGTIHSRLSRGALVAAALDPNKSRPRKRTK
jgi:hypothetical protein